MQKATIQIPYSHNDKSCIMEVNYDVNSSPITSGFEIVKNLVSDLNICIGYPTMHAYIKDHEGYGFSRYCGFIQILEIKTKNENYKMIDGSFAEKGIPFFAYGFPSEAYDAPVNNYGLGNELEWIAKTFLVDMPSFANNNLVSFLAGFKWGYNSDKEKNIDIIPIEIINQDYWIEELSFLKENCSNWNFG